MPICFVFLQHRRDGHDTPPVFSLAGPKPSPAVIGTPAVGGSGDSAAEGVADISSSDTQQAAGTDGLSTSASDTGLTSTTSAQAEHPAEASTAATAANLEQAHKAGANADAQEQATSTAGVDSSSEAAASGPVNADLSAGSSHKVDGKEPVQAGQSDEAAAGAVSDHANVAVEEAEAAEGLAAAADAEQAEATGLNTYDASALSAQAPVHELHGAQDWPELSGKQAFAAIQFATGTDFLVGRCCGCCLV